MNGTAHSNDRGFSLVELTIALVVTLIVTGAIYGLLAGGQSAFRREPELSDRQQNIRVAMDLIMKDIGNAGSGMPPFVQVFTRNLDGPTCTGCTAGGAPLGLSGPTGNTAVKADELEMIVNDGSRDNEPVCRRNWTDNATTLRLARNVIPASPAPAWPHGPVVIIFADGTWTMRSITAVANGAPGGTAPPEINCTANNPTALTFGSPEAIGVNVAGTTCAASGSIVETGTPAMGNAGTGTLGCTGTGAGPCCTAIEIAYVNVVRYRIRNGGDGVPELQRYTTATDSFVTVARGIEDMQVQYTQANGTVTPGGGVNGAPTVTVNNFNTLVTQVTVSLSSRSEARNISGMTTDGNLGTRLRGVLTYTGSPRAALISLANQGGGTLWR